MVKNKNNEKKMTQQRIKDKHTLEPKHNDLIVSLTPSPQIALHFINDSTIQQWNNPHNSQALNKQFQAQS